MSNKCPRCNLEWEDGGKLVSVGPTAPTWPESPAPCPVCADSLSLLEMLGGYFEQCIEDRRGVPNAELILSQIKNAIAKAAEGCGK